MSKKHKNVTKYVATIEEKWDGSNRQAAVIECPLIVTDKLMRLDQQFDAVSRRAARAVGYRTQWPKEYKVFQDTPIAAVRVAQAEAQRQLGMAKARLKQCEADVALYNALEEGIKFDLELAS